MTEQSFDSKFLEIVGPAIASVLVAALGWLTGGAGYLSVALTVVGGLSALTFSIMYQRYLGVLASGGARKGSPARAAYDTLRQSLSGENVVARIYIQRLRAFLDRLERFFGDVGMADRSLFPHFFGLRIPAPSWTAPAFDRCLLLALIYPIVTIVLFWMVSGHIGPAETALHLPPGTSGWRRAAGVVLIFLSSCAWSWCYQAEGRVKKLVLFAVASAFTVAVAVVLAVAVAVAGALAVAGFFVRAFAGVFGLAFAIAGVVTVTVAVAVAVASASAGADADTVAFAFAAAVASVVAVALTVTFAGPISGAFIFAFAVAVVVAAALPFVSAVADVFAGPVAFAVAIAVTFAVAFTVAFAGTIAVALAFAGAFAIKSYLASAQQHWTFLAVLVAGSLALIIGITALLASSPVWTAAGPLLLFIGLLTLINAPFDWISLGLTRALLRRGLELGGWWPYFFALTDAMLAAAIITLLAAAMVVGVQAFDTATVHSGGEPVLPLKELFDNVRDHSSEPENWWLYALLISSMIPSMLNLAIGGVAFLRGVPGLPSVVLGFLPAGKAAAPFDRAWIALVLTAQTFFGAALGAAAQAILAIGVIDYGLPWLGFHILHFAHDLADFNLPERVWALFVG